MHFGALLIVCLGICQGAVLTSRHSIHQTKSENYLRKPPARSSASSSASAEESLGTGGEEEEEAAPPCGVNCGGGSSQEEINKLRIEKIKRRILHKLRLKSRPNATISRAELPSPLSHGAIRSKVDQVRGPRYEYYGRLDHVIIFPDQDSHPCSDRRSHPAECLHFSKATSFPDGDVSSAQLWVYKVPDANDFINQTFRVANMVSDHHGGGRHLRHVASLTTSLSSGWIKFQVKHAINQWHRNGGRRGRTDQWLEVICRTCAMNASESPIAMEPGQKPFLVLEIDSSQEKSRSKRNANCDPGVSHCCRESLYVSFEEIGWDDWIVQPKGYTANYCKGSCTEDAAITMSGSHYTTVMQRFVQNKSLTADQKTNLAPCCTPTRMSEISLLYLDDNRQILQKNLPDMVVEACGCS